MAIVVTPEERRLSTLYAQLVCEGCGGAMSGTASSITDFHRWTPCGHQACARCAGQLWRQFAKESRLLKGMADRLARTEWRFGKFRPIPPCPLCIALGSARVTNDRLRAAFDVEHIHRMVLDTFCRVERRAWWGIPRAWSRIINDTPVQTTTVYDEAGRREISYRNGKAIEPLPAELPAGIVRFPQGRSR